MKQRIKTIDNKRSNEFNSQFFIFWKKNPSFTMENDLIYN